MLGAVFVCWLFFFFFFPIRFYCNQKIKEEMLVTAVSSNTTNVSQTLSERMAVEMGAK